MGVRTTMPSVPKVDSWKPVFHNTNGSNMHMIRTAKAMAVYML